MASGLFELDLIVIWFNGTSAHMGHFIAKMVLCKILLVQIIWGYNYSNKLPNIQYIFLKCYIFITYPRRRMKDKKCRTIMWKHTTPQFSLFGISAVSLVAMDPDLVAGSA